MSYVSVANASNQLGVNVSRIHQRINDGSLKADRIGAQWAVDELSLLNVAELKRPGRPLSERSVWALIAAACRDDHALRAVAPAERMRARSRFRELCDLVAQSSLSEDDVCAAAAMLRSRFRNRAQRRQYRGAAADLDELQSDRRWRALLEPAIHGIASVNVEGYIARDDELSLARDYLLVEVDMEPNVIVHVVSSSRSVPVHSALLAAADLAEHRQPREELRAAVLLAEVFSSQVRAG